MSPCLRLLLHGRVVAVLCVAGLFAIVASGCTRGAGGLHQNELPCDLAWQKLRNDRSGSEFWNDLFGVDEKGQKTVIGRANERFRQMEEEMKKSADGTRPVDAFAQLVDMVSQDLAKELAISNEVRAAQDKLVLLLENVSAPDEFKNDMELEVAMSSIAFNLQRNQEFKNNFLVLGMTDAAAQRALKAAGAGEFFDFKQPVGVDVIGPARYDPETIYVLQARFFPTRDVSMHRLFYNMAVTVNKASDRSQLYGKNYKFEYRFQPYIQRWITVAEDERRQRAVAARSR